MDTYICLKGCGSYYKYIDEDDNNKEYCVSSCDFFKNKQLYHDDSNHECVSECKYPNNIITKNGRCSDKCDTSDYYYQEEGRCYVQCPIGTIFKTKILSGIKCCQKCKDVGYYANENGECVSDCSSSITNYKYNDQNTMKCAVNCNDHLIEDFTCLKYDTCSEGRYKLDDKYCLKNCPLSKRYSIQKICRSNCTGFTYYNSK